MVSSIGKREAILQAAWKLTLHDEYSKTTIADIAHGADDVMTPVEGGGLVTALTDRATRLIDKLEELVLEANDYRRDEGGRFRTWDTCVYGHFTTMAGGHYPRTQQRARFRQRFMHKLVYLTEWHGTGGCMGCGRCALRRPAGVGIEEITAALSAEKEKTDHG